MKKKILFLLALVPFFVMACGGNVEELTEPDWIVYENDRYGFSLEYPEYFDVHPIEMGISDERYEMVFFVDGECADCLDKMQFDILYMPISEVLASYKSIPDIIYFESEVDGRLAYVSSERGGLKGKVRDVLIYLDEDRTLQVNSQGSDMNQLALDILQTLVWR